MATKQLGEIFDSAGALGVRRGVVSFYNGIDAKVQQLWSDLLLRVDLGRRRPPGAPRQRRAGKGSGHAPLQHGGQS
jgi:hypothetical protein